MRLFDTHCHLMDRAFDPDREAVLSRAWDAGLVGVLCLGYDLASSRAAVALARENQRVWAAVGIHPHHAAAEKAAHRSPGGLEAALRSLARQPRVVALGEAGLDFYRNLSPRPVQREVFELQAALALELGLPLVVHDRDAHDETLAVLTEHYAGRASDPVQGSSARRRPGVGVMHCFSGDWDLASACLQLGFDISFAGPLTFPGADKMRAVAAKVPVGRLLAETDAPYLAPAPHRGKRNEPAHVEQVARTLAAVRGVSAEELASLTTANALSFLGLS